MQSMVPYDSDMSTRQNRPAEFTPAAVLQLQHIRKAVPEAAVVDEGGKAPGPTHTSGSHHVPPPTLEEIMSSVCKHSEPVRHAVALHLDSVHDRTRERAEDVQMEVMPTIPAGAEGVEEEEAGREARQAVGEPAQEAHQTIL
jgi:hypothetical protein